MSLEDTLRRADPLRGEALGFDDVLDELREEIVTRPVVARRRPPRQRRRVVPALAVVLAATAAALIVFFAPGDRGAEPAWAVHVARSAPRLLVGNWKVTRADELTVGEGEMDFSDGARSVQLSWRKGDDPVQKDGVIGWTQDGYALELRGEAAAAARAALRAVSVDEWLGAMPAGVVRPDASDAVIDGMLADLPLPPGFDRARLDTAGAPRDRYQLGVRVVGAVACGWIETWLASEGQARAEARAQLQTARRWTVVRELAREGHYHEVLFQYADAIAGDGKVAGGKTTSVARSYADALGC